MEGRVNVLQVRVLKILRGLESATNVANFRVTKAVCGARKWRVFQDPRSLKKKAESSQDTISNMHAIYTYNMCVYIYIYFIHISHIFQYVNIYIYGKTIHLSIASVHDSAPARPPTRWARLNQNRWMPRMAASWLATNGEVPHRTVVAWGKVGGGVFIYIYMYLYYIYTCLEWYVLFCVCFLKVLVLFWKDALLVGFLMKPMSSGRK